MADYNHVTPIGRITRDPELRRTPGGTAVADLTLATSRRHTKDGEQREDKLFIDITTWDRLAENCVTYLKKGSSIFVEGYLKLDQWEDKEGQRRSKISVNASNVQFLDPKSRDQDAPPEPERHPAAPQGRPLPAPTRAPARAAMPSGIPVPGRHEYDDDTPY